MAGSDGRQRAGRGQGERLRTEILQATQRLLARTSDESAVSIRAVAEEVGVTPPSIYLHFADKDDLLVAVCEHSFERLSRVLEEAASGTDDPMESIPAAAGAYIRFGLAHPEEYRILFLRRAGRETEDRELERLRASSGFNLLLDTVQRCLDRGDVKRAEPMELAVGLWSLAHGITSLMICRPSFEWPPLEQLIEHAYGAYLDGLRSEGPPRREADPRL